MHTLTLETQLETYRAGLALEWINSRRWGVRYNVVEFVLRAFAEDPAGAGVALPRRGLAEWFNIDTRYAYRVLEDLADQQVLIPVRGRGKRPTVYFLRDPRHWRGVPWRFDRPRDDRDAMPTILRERLEAIDLALATPRDPDAGLVARYVAPLDPRSGALYRAMDPRSGATPSRHYAPATPPSGAIRRAANATPMARHIAPLRRDPDARTQLGSSLGIPLSRTQDERESRAKAQEAKDQALLTISAAITAKARAPIYGRPLDQLAQALEALDPADLDAGVARGLAAVDASREQFGAPALANYAAVAVSSPAWVAPRPPEPAGAAQRRREANPCPDCLGGWVETAGGVARCETCRGSGVAPETIAVHGSA